MYTIRLLLVTEIMNWMLRPGSWCRRSGAGPLAPLTHTFGPSIQQNLLDAWQVTCYNRPCYSFWTFDIDAPPIAALWLGGEGGQDASVQPVDASLRDGGAEPDLQQGDS